MAGATVIFYIFLAILIVLLIRWSIRVLLRAPKPITGTAAEIATREARARATTEVRRTAVYTIDADSRANDPNNFTDFYWDVGPQSSRHIDALGKDDKDLPSYEEVMRMEMELSIANSLQLSTATTTPATQATTATPVTPVTPIIPNIAASSV